MTPDDDRARVFISYSRTDSGRAESLRDRLVTAGFDAYLDVHDIKPGEPWRERLGALIGGAEKVVFVISSASVRSEICGWEVDHAERLGKSIVPVMIRETPLDAVPGRLSRLNLVFMRSDSEFDAAFDGLVEALSIDLAWEREKTRINDLAMTWDAAGRPRRLLMFANDAIVAAERWRDNHPPTSPLPSEIQLAYVAESRAGRARRQRAGMVTALLVAAALGVLSVIAYFQREAALVSEQLAEEQRGVAEEQRGLAETNAEEARRQAALAAEEARRAEAERDEALKAQSRFLARASGEALREGDIGNAVALARAALPTDLDDPDRPVIDEAVEAVTEAVAAERRELRAVRGVRYLYDGYATSPDETRLLALIKNGDPAALIDTATLEVVAELDGVSGPGVAGRFSPDGTRVVTWGAGNEVRFFAAETGAPGHVFTAHARPITDLVFSPDGSMLVTTSDDGTARLWNAATGEAGPVFSGHDGPVRGAAFGPDGVTVATWSDDRTVRVWDTVGGTAGPVLRHDEPLERVSFGGGGTRILTWSRSEEAGAEGSVVRLWDASDGGEVLPSRAADRLELVAARFTPDGSRIVDLDGDTAVLLDVVDGSVIHELRGHSETIRGYRFDPAGRVVLTWAGDRTVRIWDLDDGQEVAVFDGHDDIIVGAAFSEDGGRVVSWGFDETARIWDAATGAQRAVLRGHDGTVSYATFLHDGRTVFTASGFSVDDMIPEYAEGGLRDRTLDGTFRLWDARSGAQIGMMAGYEVPPIAVVVLPSQDRVIGASLDLSTRLWDIARDAGGPGKEIRVASGPVVTARFSPDGKRLMVGSGDIELSDFGYAPGPLDNISVWDAASGAQVVALEPQESAAGAAFDRDGGRLVLWTQHSGQAEIHPVSPAEAIASLETDGEQIRGAVRSADGGRLLTWGHDHGARVWDLASGEATAVLNGEEAITGADFSPDARRIVTWGGDTLMNRMMSSGGDRLTAQVWDATSGKAGPALSGHDSQVTGAAFSPDGRQVATWSGGIAGGDNTVHLYDATTGETLRVLDYRDTGLQRAVFSPAGDWTLGWGLGGIVLWDRSGTVISGDLYHYTHGVTPPAFSPDGRRLLLIDIDGNLAVIDVATLAIEREIQAPDGPFIGAGFSPDGQWIVAWAHDDAVRLWPASLAAAVGEADRLIVELEPLSLSERCLFVPGLAEKCTE